MDMKWRRQGLLTIHVEKNVEVIVDLQLSVNQDWDIAF